MKYYEIGDRKTKINMSETVFRGEWSAGMSYNKKDVVTFRGTDYYCTQYHVSEKKHVPVPNFVNSFAPYPYFVKIEDDVKE